MVLQTRTPTQLQECGSDCLSTYHYADALRYFTEAIDLSKDEIDPLLYVQRSLANLKCNRAQEALSDAERAIALSPNNYLGFVRKGRALMILMQFEDALQTLNTALTLMPVDGPHRKIEYWIEQIAHNLRRTKRLSEMNDDFECSLCLKLFYDPVTLSCGHTFCRSCIARCIDHNDKCPLCREVFYADPTHQPVSISLRNIIQKNFPQEYNERQEEVQQEEEQLKATLPLFPLDAVVFPGGSFPMHIFEPRYRLMLRRVMAGSKQFGLVGIRPDNTSSLGYSVCTIGCSLKVRYCNTLPDGRSMIDTIGAGRFRIVDDWEQDGYLVGRVEWLQDILPVSDAEKALAVRLIEEIIERIRAYRTRYSGAIACPSLSRLMQRIAEMPDAGNTPEQWNRFSYWLCDTLPTDLDTKQRLLEMNSCNERLQAVIRCLDSPVSNPHACNIL